jgi:hypothetical protein
LKRKFLISLLKLQPQLELKRGKGLSLFGLPSFCI